MPKTSTKTSKSISMKSSPKETKTILDKTSKSFEDVLHTIISNIEKIPKEFKSMTTEKKPSVKKSSKTITKPSVKTSKK